MNDFSGKVALVTGGGSGMGRAISVALARAGASVAICGRRPEPLAETVSLCEEHGARALAVPTDVRDPEAVDAFVERATTSLGVPDVLVNNAAGNFICPAIDLSPNGWRAVVDIVLNGSFYCSTAVARRMRDAGKGGAMLSIVATYAWTGNPGTAHSAAAKAGVWNLTKTLAVEWAPLGIRVNCIAPGVTATEGASAHLFPTEEIQAAMTARVPLRRFASLHDITSAALFLLSDTTAGYVTGECLTLDGGMSLAPPMFEPPLASPP